MDHELTSREKSETLRKQIETWSREHAADFPQEVVDLFAEKTEKLIQSGILERIRKEGDTIRDFTLLNSDGRPVRLSEQAAEGPVVLSFFRGSWCPYCRIEFESLLTSASDFQSRGATILAISPQITPFQDTSSRCGGFISLSDPGNAVSRELGLVYPLGDEIRSVYQRFGIRLEELNGDDSYEVPIPATYLIDSDLHIRYAFANVNFTERAEPSDLLAEVDRIAA
jgi:peroxiredoxin